MAIRHKCECKTHNSIYNENYLIDNYKKRKVNMYYSIPENGVNEDTGILLFISGFGGHSNSNIYVKMRDELADKYNFITIQCDYFGYQFMQNDISDGIDINHVELFNLRNNSPEDSFDKIYNEYEININEFLNTSYTNVITVTKNLYENTENCNDMGIMQAIDNVIVTKKIINELNDNNKVFNSNKVMIMGVSHGSYLAYLCNLMCPGLYTHILDNSGWIYPTFYNSPRVLYMGKNNSIKVVYNYNMKNINSTIQPLNIEEAYREFDNTCKIVVYQGQDDTLITANDKYKGVSYINNLEYKLITKSDVDNICFKSTTHGLSADFIKLFEKFYETHYQKEYEKISIEEKDEIKFSSNISINYKDGFPILSINL